jgi:hypothetical protein
MLSVSRLVKVTVNLTPQAAAGRNFGILMLAGDTNVINGLERFRTYSSIEAVGLDFGTTDPEFLAAELYFGQTPQPSTLMIGRWLRTATAAQNEGGILSPSQQAVTNFNAISNGGLIIVVDGVTKTLTGLNFNGVSNLNAVATIISAALTGAVCTWNGSQFVITSNTTGIGTNAIGSVTLSSNPANNDTLTVNGTLITFVTGTPTGSQVKIGASANATAGNLQTFLQSSVDTNIDQATYSLATNVINVTFNNVGTGGNAFTLAKVSTAIALSGATLSGGTVPSSVGYATTGSGTDISALLKLTASTNIALITGYAAETPVQCAAALASKSTLWYGLAFAASVPPSDAQNLAVAPFIEALSVKRIFGVTSQDANTLSPLVTNDLASLLKAGGYERTFIQYSSSSPYAIASLFGRMFTVDFNGNNTTITLMYKQEPGIAGEDLNDTQADTLIAKRCNFFTDYDNDTKIIQNGVMSGPAYINEIQDLDWFQNALQTACYNVLYTSATKIPQTDAGVNQLSNACAAVCEEGVNNGMIAPGVWNASGFGSLSQGQYLKTGYYIFAQPVALQSQSDREARKAPPIQIAVKLAGAIQTVDILVSVNR